MAYRMQLQRPMGAMAFIWNISGTVGDNSNCRNDPMDVNLVKVLMANIIERNTQASLAFVHRSCRRPIEVNGQMDQNLAYFIRLLNIGKNLPLAQAGTVSPANPRGQYGANEAFSIVILNSQMAGQDRAAWQNIGQRHPALAGIENRSS